MTTAFTPHPKPVREPKPPRGPRQRKCAVCRLLFVPRSITHKACGPSCAQVVAEGERKAQERKADRARKQALKSRQDHIKDAQAAINAWVRLVRDREDGCISCDKPATWHGQWHASHYASVGASPATRFDPANIHKSCSVCNNILSGNIRAYRPRLIEKIGIAEVDRLEGHQPFRKWHEAELVAIKDEYRRKLKAKAP